MTRTRRIDTMLDSLTPEARDLWIEHLDGGTDATTLSHALKLAGHNAPPTTIRDYRKARNEQRTA